MKLAVLGMVILVLITKIIELHEEVKLQKALLEECDKNTMQLIDEYIVYTDNGPEMVQVYKEEN